jgi:ABC-type multidrug transport system permease subunit
MNRGHAYSHCNLLSVAIPKADFPTFWKFMHPVSPGTYLVGGVMAAALGGTNVTCTETEMLEIAAPSNLSCGAFLDPFATETGGNLLNPDAMDTCRYCVISTTDQFLSRFDIYYKDAWRNFGVLWVYILFNVAAAVALYWVFRVPRRGRKQ